MKENFYIKPQETKNNRTCRNARCALISLQKVSLRVDFHYRVIFSYVRT